MNFKENRNCRASSSLWNSIGIHTHGTPDCKNAIFHQKVQSHDFYEKSQKSHNALKLPNFSDYVLHFHVTLSDHWQHFDVCVFLCSTALVLFIYYFLKFYPLIQRQLLQVRWLSSWSAVLLFFNAAYVHQHWEEKKLMLILFKE